MTLSELVMEKYLSGMKSSGNLMFDNNDLRRYKDEIMGCDEFSECTELEILDYPMYECDGVIKYCDTYPHKEGNKYYGKVRLYSICMTPEIYDPTEIYKIVKDGAAVTPSLYDFDRGCVTKKIMLEVNMDSKEGDLVNGENLLRQELHEKLDKVLDNPKDYTISGKRYINLRGVLEMRKSCDVGDKSYLSQDMKDFDYFPVLYYDGGNIRARHVPNKLREKIFEKFGNINDTISISKDDIDKFLIENG